MSEERNEVAMRLSVAIAEGHIPPIGLVNSLILDGVNEIHRLESQRDRLLEAIHDFVPGLAQEVEKRPNASPAGERLVAAIAECEGEMG